jgi:hypothetical protein
MNFVRGVVEGTGSLFHRIEQENDLGIDALIEFVRGEEPMKKIIASQVKSGESYYDRRHNACLIPVGGHREYWQNYPVPVVGIAYIPSLDEANWTDLKDYLRRNPTANTAKFARTAANRFDAENFVSVFMPLAMRETPILPHDQALSLFLSRNADERQLGLAVLFRRYPNSTAAWDAFIDVLGSTPRESVPPVLIHYLAHIPWHGDIFYRGEVITESTREHVLTRLRNFRKPEVLKLLEFIDRDSMLSRGSCGQSVEAIISAIPVSASLLEEIVSDAHVPLFRRECAALIFTMYQGRGASGLLARLSASGSSYAQELLEYLRHYGKVNPYV